MEQSNIGIFLGNFIAFVGVCQPAIASQVLISLVALLKICAFATLHKQWANEREIWIGLENVVQLF